MLVGLTPYCHSLLWGKLGAHGRTERERPPRPIESTGKGTKQGGIVTRRHKWSTDGGAICVKFPEGEERGTRDVIVTVMGANRLAMGIKWPEY